MYLQIAEVQLTNEIGSANRKSANHHKDWARKSAVPSIKRGGWGMGGQTLNLIFSLGESTLLALGQAILSLLPSASG